MRFPIQTVLLAGALLFLQACGTTIHPGERGLRWYPLTTGLSPEPLRTGFYWRAPWNDILLYDVTWQSHTEIVDALSSDNVPVELKTSIVMRPIPGEVYYLAQEVGSDFYPRFVKPEFIAAVRTVVSNYPITQVPEKVGEIGNKVQAIVENKLKGRHLDVAFVFPWPISSSQGSYSKPLQDLQAKGQ